MHKVIIWMNMPSHHQSAFFEALFNHENINIQIRYFDKISDHRKLLGWESDFTLPIYQKYVTIHELSDNFPTISDWEDRIHIVPGFSHPFLKKLIEKLITNNVDWIHWSEKSGKPFTRLLKYNYPVINFLKPFYFKLNKYYRHGRKINNHALGAFAISELAKRDFLKWGVNEKYIKILNYSIKGLQKSNENPLNNILSNVDKVFMYCGVLTKHKGIEVLLKAISQVKSIGNWKLILVGHDLSNGKYKTWIKKLGLTEKVFFIGSVTSKKMNQYMNQADVFILPTLFDGWGMVLNEAASLGKPLISTNLCGAALHLINDGVNGFRIKSNSVTALKLAMEFYIENEDKIIEHGNQSFHLFNKNLPERNAELFNNYICELKTNLK